MTADLTLKPGDYVKAFHPRTLGVIRTGSVVSAGPKWVRIDFGRLLGGTLKVARRDVVDYA